MTFLGQRPLESKPDKSTRKLIFFWFSVTDTADAQKRIKHLHWYEHYVSTLKNTM